MLTEPRPEEAVRSRSLFLHLRRKYTGNCETLMLGRFARHGGGARTGVQAAASSKTSRPTKATTGRAARRGRIGKAEGVGVQSTASRKKDEGRRTLFQGEEGVQGGCIPVPRGDPLESDAGRGVPAAWRSRRE